MTTSPFRSNGQTFFTHTLYVNFSQRLTKLKQVKVENGKLKMNNEKYFATSRFRVLRKK